MSTASFQQYNDAMLAGDVETASKVWEQITGYPLGASMAKMKEIDARNSQRATLALMREHAGRHTLGTDWLTEYWAAAQGPTHDRDLGDVVYQLVTTGCLTPQGAVEAVERGWTIPEFPEANLGHDKWLDLFREVGYLEETDDEDDDTPAQPRGEAVLYRGAIPSRRRGLAWTTNRERAQWFADRFSSSLDKSWVYEIRDVPTEAILARFNARGEDEVVVDVKNLRVRRI